MKTTTKILLAGAALVAAGAANAQAVGGPITIGTSPNGSDLVLFVTDTTTQVGFIQDLQVNVNSLGQTTVSIAADAAAGNQYNSFGLGTTGSLSNPIGTNGVDAALASFLSAHTGDSFVYGILGAATGTGTAQPGQGRVVASYTAANAAALFANEPSTSTVQGASQQVNAFLYSVNTGANPLFGASTGTGFQNTGVAGELADAALGTTVFLNELSTMGQNDANIYETSTGITVSANGSISGFATGGGTTPVPLPAAIWLLGSGVLGLFGIGRRRGATVKA